MKAAYGLMLAVAAAAGLMSGCETVDESAPSRPRTTFLPADANAQNNAEKRELEAPQREEPMLGREHVGGQSSAAPATTGSRVLLADAHPLSAPIGNQMLDGTGKMQYRGIGKTPVPETTYQNDWYTSSMPHLPENPGTTPQVGTILVPGGDWSIDASWGQGMQLQDYPHRPWPTTTAVYQVAQVPGNPQYYFDAEQAWGIRKEGDTYVGNAKSAAIEVPWWYFNTAALPVLMVLEPPLTPRTEARLGSDPMYLGYLPAGGPVVPTPGPAAATTTTTSAPASSPAETSPAK